MRLVEGKGREFRTALTARLNPEIDIAEHYPEYAEIFLIFPPTRRIRDQIEELRRQGGN